MKFTLVWHWKLCVDLALFPLFRQLTNDHLKSDLVEYNQCQAMLKNLYDLGITGKEEEFTAYRILMWIHGRNRSGQLSSQTS